VLKYLSINYKQLKLIMPYTQFGDWAQSTGGETSCSHPRRKQNNFFDKYLKCKEKVLEIGGTTDPIVTWADNYDQQHCINPTVDATFCKEILSESYDVVNASHVLEHIANCYLGIKNWYRLLKPGGILIITVPHVDLYERKSELPSEGNSNHKYFIHDSEDRLPYTLNLKNLIRGALLDENYKLLEYNVCENPDFDNRKTKWPEHPQAEYQIEVVIQKFK
jgi:predicted SAM-dependent methyltransferase